MHGVVNFLKPPGMTSHDAVALLRRTTGVKRIGHTGTLDPAAAGVLPLCIGQATRLVEYLQEGTKEYVAELTFGHETDTCDAMGATIASADATGVTRQSLEAVLPHFLGMIDQVPPLYSAIKQDGKKLYELARAGASEESVDLQPRAVTISRITIERFQEVNPTAGNLPLTATNNVAGQTAEAAAVSPPCEGGGQGVVRLCTIDQMPVSVLRTVPVSQAILRVECTGGTYIRSLVRDIGRALGCGATMTFLVRTRNGRFPIAEAVTVEEIGDNVRNCLIPMSRVLPWCVDAVIENPDAARRLAQGRIVRLDIPAPQPARMLVRDADWTLAAIAVPHENVQDAYKAEKVLDLGTAAS